MPADKSESRMKNPDGCFQFLCLGPRELPQPPLMVAQALGMDQSRAGEQLDLEESDHLEETWNSLSQKPTVLSKAFTNTV